MKIDLDEVRHIADLSRLRFDPEESEAMAEHLGQVLEYFETLDAAIATDVQPTAHILSAVNVLREDEAGVPMPRDALLQNAPETDNENYLVPKVLE